MANVIRRSAAVAAAAASVRASKRLEQQIHELNNAPEERVFQEGAKQNGAKPGGGNFYRGLGGFDETLIVKR